MSTSVFDKLKNLFGVSERREYPQMITVVDFTRKADYHYFDEFREMLRPKIVGGNIQDGELISVEFEKMVVPSRWIREIKAVTKELNMLTSKNKAIKEIHKRDRGEVATSYSIPFISAATPLVPYNKQTIEEEYSCLGKIKKSSLPAIAMACKKYFDAMDDDLLNALSELNCAHNNFNNTIIYGPQCVITPVNPVENFLADKILDRTFYPILIRKRLKDEIDTLVMEGACTSPEFERLSKLDDEIDCYFEYREFKELREILLYCVAITDGRRGNSTVSYYESLFDKYEVPYNLDQIPFV